MTTLKQIKPVLNFIKKSTRPILANVLVNDNGMLVTNLETSVLIKNNYDLSPGLHTIETLGLVDPDKDNIDNFPLIEFDLDPIDTIDIDLNKINTLLPFTSKDETRIYLNGIAINNGHYVACDGHTLKAIELNHKIDNDYTLPNGSMLILSKLLKKYKVNTNVTVKLNESFAVIETNDFILSSRLIRSDYVKWSSVIPTKFNKEFTIDNWINYKELKPLFNKRTNACKLELKNGNVVLTSPLFPENQYFIGKCEKSIEEEIGFNVTYLERAANGNKEFNVKYNNGLSPAMVNDAIVMPLKL